MRIAPFVLLFGLATRADADAYPLLVESFMQPVYVGMRLSFGKNFERGRLTLAQYQCLRGIPAASLAPAVERILRESLTQVELSQAEEFFGSATGRRYAQYGLMDVYRGVGEKPPEEVAELTPEEKAALFEFSRSPAGTRLVHDAVLEQAAARASLGAAIREVAEPCRYK